MSQGKSHKSITRWPKQSTHAKMPTPARSDAAAVVFQPIEPIATKDTPARALDVCAVLQCAARREAGGAPTHAVCCGGARAEQCAVGWGSEA